MKAKNRSIALLLAALLLFAAAMPAFAEAELVKTAEMCYTIPTIGDKAGSLHYESADPDKYLISVDEIYCFVIDENGKSIAFKLNADDTFKEGVTYWVRFEFVPQKGYQLDDKQTTFIINGRDKPTYVGKMLRETAFTPKAPTEKDNAQTGLCPYCHKDHTGFLSFVVVFFHKILYRLFGEKK